jgi:hypothetical protein
LTALALVAAPQPAEAIMYGANCRTGLTQWAQEPDGDGRHQRLAAPIPIDGATVLWCRDEVDVTIEVVPIELDDGRAWYLLRAVHPAPSSSGDAGLLDEVDLVE